MFLNLLMTSSVLVVAITGSVSGMAAGRGYSWIESQEVQERVIMEADLAAAAEADEIDAQVYLNPGKRFIAGTARLRFHTPGAMKMFGLCEELKIHDIVSPDSAIQLFRREGRVFVVGAGLRDVSVYFHGTLPAPRNELQETLISYQPPVFGKSDQFLMLSRCTYFIPSTTRRFMRSRIVINVPVAYSCLASGQLVETVCLGEMRRYTFVSKGTRGISLTCGDFRPVGQVPAAVAVNLYASPLLNVNRYYDTKRLGEIVDYFAARFGKLDISELNLLFSRDCFFGGYSHSGYIVGFLDAGLLGGPDESLLKRVRLQSPLAMNDARWDCLVHEIAHQWWGGLLSGQIFSDVWITEGLAQYSTLLYLRDHLPPAEFDDILTQMSGWIKRKAAAGRVTDGQGIAFTKKDPLAYQAIVYNKSGLIFWMLGELIGEKELIVRLRGLLTEHRYSCWSSQEFMAQLVQDDPLLRRFFADWVQRMELPDISCRTVVQDGKARITIKQRQAGAMFVLPLHVKLNTASGSVMRVLTVSRESETFAIDVGAAIRSVDVMRGLLPARVRL